MHSAAAVWFWAADVWMVNVADLYASSHGRPASVCGQQLCRRVFSSSCCFSGHFSHIFIFCVFCLPALEAASQSLKAKWVFTGKLQALFWSKMLPWPGWQKFFLMLLLLPDSHILCKTSLNYFSESLRLEDVYFVWLILPVLRMLLVFVG